ncbi:glycoside hydrolase family 2 TIM barrel-domain containing protein [Faecalicatena orotica]|uniref:glycoside hydrolase family 2 TIM barrel-domain containing protein n=1 Tax=Faecalicatena orotica TaxID=1544 RepID=UPI003216EF3B
MKMRLDFNDNWMVKMNHSEWKKVMIPHDAMQEEARNADAKGGSASGFFHGGHYIYQKELNLTLEELELHYTLEFGGVYRDAEVYINGNLAGSCAYGYVPFRVVMDPFLKEGRNIVTVKADNSDQPDSRWYTGAGIYRSVFLRIQKKQHLIPEQIRIRTLQIQPAKVEVQTGHAGGRVHVEITDPEIQKTVASGDGSKVELKIENAVLWDSGNPHLYQVNVQLWDRDEILEEIHISYGIRLIEKKTDGLYINKQKVLLKGGCIHHDNGILGAREYQESADRKIRILKENGFNAIRSAHNPCSEEILNACDKYGIYVMDETWDMWYRKKNEFDYASEFEKHYKDDIHTIVEKDSNHPSVILYSIGNEVSEPAEQRGIQLAEELVSLFHKEDPARLVTGGFNLMIIANAAKGKQMYQENGGLDASQNKDLSGMNSTMFNMITSMTGSGMNKAANGKKADLAVSPVLDKLDISGYNYASGRYQEDSRKHPERLILGSETFPQDLAANWKMVEEMPNIIGDFMWTAWDYLGEAGLGAWSYDKDAKGFAKPYPWLLADCGVFDILGNPTGEALWTKIIWGGYVTPEITVRPCNHPKEKLIKAAWRGTNALPSWSWRGCDGNRTIVEIYADAYVAELFLNGKKIGERKIKNKMAKFPVKYQTGELKTIVYDCTGKEAGRKTICSGTGAVKPSIIPEQDVIKSGAVCYLNVAMMCENGIVDCNSDEILTIQVENGKLLAFGSANPKTEESFLTGQYCTWYGKAMAVVRAGTEGKLHVTVKSAKYTTTKEITIVG